MLEALVSGTTDPQLLSELARGRLRAKIPALREALEGRFDAQHALIVSATLAHLDFLDQGTKARRRPRTTRASSPSSLARAWPRGDGCFYRKAQIGERQREANRLHKLLEDTGINRSESSLIAVPDG